MAKNVTYEWTDQESIDKLGAKLLLDELSGDDSEQRFEEEQARRDYEYYRFSPPITQEQIEFEQELEGDNDEPYNAWVDEEKGND